MAAGRGAVLLAIAVGLGVVLLNATDTNPVARVRTSGPRTSATVPPNATSTTVATLPLRAPRDIKVLAANSTRVKGAAGRITESLRGQGYNVLAPTDAPAVAATVVYYGTGFEREAVEVARALTLNIGSVQAMPPTPPIPDIRGANILVIVGPDLAGPEPTTTTAKKTTTTTSKATTTTAKPATTTSSPATTTARPTTTTARPATSTTSAP